MNDNTPPPGNPRTIALLCVGSPQGGLAPILANLAHEFTHLGLRVDLLGKRCRGPRADALPTGVRRIELRSMSARKSLLPLIRYLRRERPAAILADTDKGNRLALWARHLARVPTRVAVRVGTTKSKALSNTRAWKRFWRRQAVRWFYAWADVVITPSRGAAEDIAYLIGVSSESIQVLPNPVVRPALETLSREPVTHRFFSDGAPPVIVGAGGLSARKDFATLLRAFVRVRHRRACRLLILGEGRERPRLRSLANELGVAPDVDIPGFVVNPYKFMRRAAVFVLSSRYEGFAMVLAEALAVGTPVVSTDCPSGPREILQDGRYGPLVPVGDSEAMAEAIRKVMDEPLPPEVLKRAAAPFDVTRSAAAYLQAMGIKP